MDYEKSEKPEEKSDLRLKLRKKIRDMQRKRWEGESIRVRRRTFGRVVETFGMSVRERFKQA